VAQSLIATGVVTVGGAPATKASRLVGRDEPVEVLAPRARFVSRGGEKLDAALERFAVDVAGRRALDAGASTGGFTDCLLQRGAAEVVALDVGHGQLHERLRADPRVRVHERLNLRHTTAAEIGGPFPVVVADLSFISLRTVLPALAGELAEPDADLVLLVKPQFEAGRAEASRGKGVVTDPVVWRRVLGEVGVAMTAQSAAMMDAMVSPLRGADGNVEFLVHARAGAVAPGPGPDLDAVVASAGAG
jgi:23S rRNA (cytidine1920-2'-O)/16S rRNA (cytidine1409-2'-O)-methyltransferase